jgi:pimeloyl-ACP methyl ester carboxylesterase
MRNFYCTALTLFLFCSRALAQTTQPVPYDNNPAAGKYYDINGFKMYTETYGDGPPLLMIHGNGSSMKAFTHNIPYFAQHYKVILADSRSQGKSLDLDHPLTFEMMADDFAALLDALHIDNAYVIGHSDGGINALLLAIRHPQKVKKLIASGANLWPTADAFKPGVWDHDKIHYDTGINQKHTTDKEKNAWKLFLLDWNEPHITLDQLHTIECPCLIVSGDHDVIALPHTLVIYQNIKHANLWVLPNSGHGTMQEHADEFDRKADEFFSQAFVDRQ